MQEIRKTRPEDEKKLDELDKLIKRLLTKVKTEDPDYLPTIEKFTLIASIDLKEKKEGTDSATHIQPKR